MANLFATLLQRRSSSFWLASIVVAVVLGKFGHFVGMWDGPARRLIMAPSERALSLGSRRRALPRTGLGLCG